MLSIIWCAPIITGKPKEAILLKFVGLISARIKGVEGLSRFDNYVRKKENSYKRPANSEERLR